ncbi:MAG TPA: aromatic amino acid lyase, partial [Phycisphaerales bacterium]|nr:aromatic amino acid lyase [Phycisphaerales bacterium]
MSKSSVVLGANPIGIEQLESVARGGARASLSAEARRAIARSRDRLASVLHDGEPHYGVNTGFGSFSRQRISAGDLADLQRHLVRSHAAGVGHPLPREV